MFLEPEYWFLQYALCEITNDIENRNFLIENITEKVMRKYSNEADIFLKSEFAFIDFLMALHLQITSEEQVQIYENAVDIVNNEAIDDEKTVTYKDEMITNPFKVFSTFLYKTNEKEFNELLYDAIEGFKYYDENYDENESPEFWQPILLISAAASMIYNKNYNILFTSDYLPMWLIEKSIEVAK
ncbi:Imm49 family immunity protein [Dokdonia sp.]|uniref:Imm49 family immunity protein n=1 Tax=Dokdonia sp. TaxID=2024995 RepID=UPI003264EA3B